jgi:hypothetical protein
MNHLAISGSDSCWINGTILNFWLIHVFITHVQRVRNKMQNNDPALLILDNHASRDTIQKEQLWNDHQIMILLFSPNTTHLT